MNNYNRLLVALALLTSISGCQAQRLSSPPNAEAVAPTRTLRLAYSAWPGWLAWDVGIQKGWFREAEVPVDLIWFEYGPSIDAFAAGKVDAVSLTHGDALITGSSGSPSKCIVANDYSNGNDMIVAKPGVKGMAGLKGKRIGVELGMLSHLLLSKALETAPLSETDVTLVNVATEEAPQALKSGAVDAIAAWQPFGGQALHELPGASVVFSSKNTPGLIFDLLCVNPRSLAERRADWTKVVEVWFKIAAFINDPANVDEAAQIMGARIGLAADDYKWLMQGTFFLGLEGNLKAWKQSEGTGSVYGSSKVVDSFYTRNNMYKAPVKYSEYFDGSIVQAISGSQ